MIVRIATEGQYELTANDVEVLGEMDNQAVAACEADDEQQFRDVFTRMVELVRSNGHPLAEDNLAPSDLILPPPDVSMDEAKGAFEGEGLIPGWFGWAHAPTRRRRMRRRDRAACGAVNS